MKQQKPSKWGGGRPGAGRPPQFCRIKLSDLHALAASWQALCNVAEVKAPQLLDDPQWQAIKTHLEEQARLLGVDTWIEKTAQKHLTQIEEIDE